LFSLSGAFTIRQFSSPRNASATSQSIEAGDGSPHDALCSLTMHCVTRRPKVGTTEGSLNATLLTASSMHRSAHEHESVLGSAGESRMKGIEIVNRRFSNTLFEESRDADPDARPAECQ
jgi:hypothetical protein